MNTKEKLERDGEMTQEALLNQTRHNVPFSVALHFAMRAFRSFAD
jgi:hypothetical protein